MPDLNDYLRLGAEVRANLDRRIDWLANEYAAPPGQEFTTAWELTLLTLCWDVSGSVFRLADLDELRSARILCRSLLEYGLRMHHYVRNPEDARDDYERIEKFAQKMMRATADFQGDMDKKQFAAYRKFASAALQKSPQRKKIQGMMESVLLNLGYSGAELKSYIQHLDIEYGIGSAIAHGSEGSILDVLPSISSGEVLHAKTSTRFSAIECATRAIMSMLLLMQAAELHHSADFGRSLHLRSLKLLMGAPQKYTFFSYVAIGPNWNAG